ncbi:MAG: short-chain dehydrogenase [Frankiales bacterium]|nr:short-chain dehydrogenase [Frankiales bacterium]
MTRPAVVTGASSGIGEATARLLASQGYPVVLGARRVEKCQAIVDELRADGHTAHALALDLADAASRDAFAKQAVEAVGDIDVLVSNAGLSRPAGALEVDEASLLEHLQVNLIGAQALAKAFGQPMVERGRGDLCFITSEVVREPRPWVAPYVSSKYALEGLVTVLMRELEGTGVRVSCIRPGQTLTEMGFDWEPARTGEILESWKKWGLARHPHFMAPSGIAAAVAACVGAPPGVSFAYVDVEPVPPPRKKAP